MPIPPAPGINVGALTKATPTPFNKQTLSKQLENAGLSCAMLQGQNLNQYIDEVASQLNDGSIESMAILKPAETALDAEEIDNVTSLAASVPSLETAATGNWTINDKAQGYAPYLEVIQFPAHFDWLWDNRASNGFTGKVDNPKAQTGDYPNAAAIQKLFVDSGVTTSSTLVKGLDKDSMLAALTNVISPLANKDLSNYLVPAKPSDPWPSLVVYLVENYNTSTGYADAIGVLYFRWTLKITDYKRKTKDGGDTHPTTLQIQAGSVLYSDTTLLCAHYNSILDHFGIDPSTAPKCPPTF